MTADEIAPAALVLTKVAVAEGLAAACAMSKVPVDAVPTDVGCLAVCRSTGIGDPEMAAQVVSGLLRTTPVILLVQREAAMTATRWAEGREQEGLSAALVLDGAPPEVERILLGRVDPSTMPGVVTSVGMSRWAAMRIMTRMARMGRKRR